MKIDLEFLAANSVCVPALQAFYHLYGHGEAEIAEVSDEIIKLIESPEKARERTYSYVKDWHAKFAELILKNFFGNKDYEDDVHHVLSNAFTAEYQISSSYARTVNKAVYINSVDERLFSSMFDSSVEMCKIGQSLTFDGVRVCVGMLENNQKLFSTGNETSVLVKGDGCQLTLFGDYSQVHATGNNLSLQTRHSKQAIVSEGKDAMVNCLYLSQFGNFGGSYIDVHDGTVQITTPLYRSFVIKARPKTQLIITRMAADIEGSLTHLHTDVIDFSKGDFIEGKYYTNDAGTSPLVEVDEDVALSYAPYWLTGVKDETNIQLLYGASAIERADKYVSK